MVCFDKPEPILDEGNGRIYRGRKSIDNFYKVLNLQEASDNIALKYSDVM